MRNWMLLALCAMLMMACSDSSDGFTLRGKVRYEPCLGKTVVMTLYHNDGTQTSDSTVVASDGTSRFEGKLDSPCQAEFLFRKGEGNYDARFNCFVENRHMTLTVRKGEMQGWGAYAKCDVKGSRTDAAYRKAFAKGYTETVGFHSFHPECDDAIAANLDEIYSVYVYYRTGFDHDEYDAFLRQMEAFGPRARNTWHYRQMERMVQTKSNLAVGSRMPDFSLPDTAGHTLSLADMLRGNRLLLVDFWASWCGPCRKEGERIKQLYDDLRGQGLQVLGVSIDTERTRWIEAIEEDGLPWPNVCELDYSDCSVARSVFGIRGVPNIVLLDADGTILATHLFGDRMDSIVRGNI